VFNTSKLISKEECSSVCLQALAGYSRSFLQPQWINSWQYSELLADSVPQRLSSSITYLPSPRLLDLEDMDLDVGLCSAVFLIACTF